MSQEISVNRKTALIASTKPAEVLYIGHLAGYIAPLPRLNSDKFEVPIRVQAKWNISQSGIIISNEGVQIQASFQNPDSRKNELMAFGYTPEGPRQEEGESTLTFAPYSRPVVEIPVAQNRARGRIYIPLVSWPKEFLVGNVITDALYRSIDDARFLNKAAMLVQWKAFYDLKSHELPAEARMAIALGLREI